MAESGLKHIAVMGSMHEIGFFEGSINEKHHAILLHHMELQKRFERTHRNDLQAE